VKNSLELLLVLVLVVSGRAVAAQDWLDSTVEGDLPPQMVLPEQDSTSNQRESESDHTSRQLRTESSNLESTAEPISSGDLLEQTQELSEGDGLRLFEFEPAILESTGTWLRRGFWHAEVDAVLLNRSFDRRGIVLMSQTTGVQVNQFGQQVGVTDNKLIVDGSRPGAEALPRLKVGRFLFRDHMNRDHTAEFIAYGGGSWSQQETLEASLDNDVGTTSLEVPVGVDSGNVSFDGATFSQFSHAGTFNSFELNYQVKQRMQQDRMELEPSGHWVRRAQPGISHSMLAGIRYFGLHEGLDWDAFGIDDADGDTLDETGNYRTRIRNDMIGTQLGISSTYETARWSLGVTSKGGMYANFAEVQTDFEVTGGVTSGSSELDTTNLSFIGETAFIGKWHLRPNVSIRTGLEVLWVASVADATRQVDFLPGGSNRIHIGGESVFMGGSIGIEGYW